MPRRPISWALSAASIALVCSVAPATAGQRPNPKPLWQHFPLRPPVTQPVPAPVAPPAVATVPVPAPQTVPTASETVDRTRRTVVEIAGGIVVLVLVAAAVLLRAKTRRPALETEGLSRERLLRLQDTSRGARPTPQQLIASARALALEAAEYDRLGLRAQRAGRVDPVSEHSDEQVVETDQARPQPDGSGARGYADIGERVAGVLAAAEEAAEQIRADGRAEAAEVVRRAERDAEEARGKSAAYESDTRAAVDSYATQRRRDADLDAQKTLSDAETQARATREAAEEMARQLEEQARQRVAQLREESRSVEARLSRARSGLQQMVAQIDELIGPSSSPESADATTLVEALDVERHRQPAGP